MDEKMCLFVEGKLGSKDDQGGKKGTESGKGK